MEQFFAYDPHLNGSKGLIFIGDKLLVYRRDSRTENFPFYLDLAGGGKEINETPFETFQREVKEEFGLAIERRDISYVRRYPSQVVKGEFAYFPVVKLDSGAKTALVFGNEGLEYKLIDIEEFLNANDVWPGLQDKARDYLNSLNERR